MILIADGGSTKADWVLLKKSGEELLRTRTGGLNPAVFDEELLAKRIRENTDLVAYKDEVTHVYFYGAGCGTEKPTSQLKSIFESFFINAAVDVKEDTYAATYAVTTEPGIVCILGTGSNSCYFDGENVDVRIASLGYILMDEASGNYFGKKLIRDYYYHKMPVDIAKQFEEQFDIDADTIKKNIYKKDNPNTYLAHFAEFIFKNERNVYFNKVLHKGMKDFFKNKILPYKESESVPVHFVGSIAYFAQDIIKDVARFNMIKLGNIVRRPIDGLIDYHRKKLKLEKL
ncbi:N-acetylglucosamine kinase [Lutibacter profundi]|uniref:N-acetylglucosamine kinase n=1 Tax=Lutibacter profundi TaxID=1622118 RepID=A0A0X8G8E8_9FLAO|nr:N-acetylglucosamine kinase [Lutibacter profundi]AMC11986.1 N-acetylglucosamine kinase [Lutibacter profundi]